jgi:hypothetical protein
VHQSVDALGVAVCDVYLASMETRVMRVRASSLASHQSPRTGALLVEEKMLCGLATQSPEICIGDHGRI